MKRYFFVALIAPLALASCNNANDTNTATATPTSPIAVVAPPPGGDWTAIVSETPDGGYQMGNPKAAVKLIEYGALSCPHCAHFMKESHDVMDKMIASGKLSYEFRTFLIHPQDAPATLLARCNGAATFFPLADQMFANQDVWMAKTSTITADVQKGWATLTPNQVAADMATRLGLDEFVAQRGISADKAKACLADKAGMDKLQHIVSVATDNWHIQGTPTFILNNSLLPDVNSWDALKPKLNMALGNKT